MLPFSFLYYIFKIQSTTLESIEDEYIPDHDLAEFAYPRIALVVDGVSILIFLISLPVFFLIYKITKKFIGNNAATIVKITYLSFVVIAYLFLCIFNANLLPIATCFWLLTTIITFVIIMCNCRKTMKIAAIPIALVCCIVAYYCVKPTFDFNNWSFDYVYMENIYLFLQSFAKYTLASWIIAILGFRLYSYFSKKQIPSNDSHTDII